MISADTVPPVCRVERVERVERAEVLFAVPPMSTMARLRVCLVAGSDAKLFFGAQEREGGRDLVFCQSKYLPQWYGVSAPKSLANDLKETLQAMPEVEHVYEDVSVMGSTDV